MRKKVSALFLAALCVFSTAATACGRGSNGPDWGDDNIYNVEDPKKTKIVVTNLDGGIGTIWLDEAAERFAELKKDEHYEDGKTGIYIEIERTSNIKLDMAGSGTSHMYFDERKWDISTLAQSGQLLDVTDIVTDATREGGSIESTIYPEKLDSLKGFDGKYYSLPHYEFFGGVSYDVDVFDECGAYFAADEETSVVTYSSKYGTARFIGSANAQRSKGPDGKANTEDDGMPCSVEQFIQLLAYFRERTSYAPIVLSGKYLNYSNYFLTGIWAALAGAEQMENYYNGTGKIEVVTGYTTENLFPGIDYIKKPIVEEIDMAADGSEGYRGQEMAAKYYAIALLEIINKEFFSPDAFTDTITHLDAQRALIFNPTDTKYTKTAMLMEASYWHNEAKVSGSFDTYKLMTGDSEERNIRFMRLPSCAYTADLEETTNTLLDIGQGVAVISSKVAGDAALTRACKEFMAFLYTTEELKAFTACTGMSRPLNYGVTQDELQNVAAFYSDLWNYSHETGKVVYYSGTTETHKKAKSYLKLCLNLPFTPQIGTTLYNNFVPAFRAGGDTKALFISTHYDADTWATIIDEDED